MTGIVMGTPRTLLRLEGLFVVVAAVIAYARMDAGWGMFAALFLVPDLSMLGYLAGPRAGAAVYNVGHWYGWSLACLAWGVFGPTPQVLAVGLIWAAHIGFDRTLGYGLKYQEGFGFSHLGLIGKTRRAS